jgi:5-methylcytosine-specific restriction enzyme A
MRNPNWHRDELILALDLYFSPDRGSIDARNPKIIALSALLNQLPLHAVKPNKDFRNPNGVSLKLSNFLAIDPTYSGKGMEAYGKLDAAIFHEFQADKQQLRAFAQQIRQVIANEPLRMALYAIEDDEVTESDQVLEGQVLYKLHKYRERNARIVARKKQSVFKHTGKLACEVCGFDFFEQYGSLGKGFIECHHIRPLSETIDFAETKVEDLALVCSNCHRMLHREPQLSVAALRSQLR